MAEPKLFMALLGCRPPGRNTEQHDIFFGIGKTMKDLVLQIKLFWPGAGNIHVDAWREVNMVDSYQVSVVPRSDALAEDAPTLYFLNLGGYREAEFDEFHYKMLVVAKEQSEAVRQAKNTAFYKHTSIQGAPSHIDDKFGVDVDDLHQVKDILTPDLKKHYSIKVEQAKTTVADKLHLGYFPLHKL